MNNDKLLTCAQVAARLNLTLAAVRQRAHRGTLPGKVRLGPRTVRWRESEINSMIENKANTMNNSDTNTTTPLPLPPRSPNWRVMHPAEMAALANLAGGSFTQSPSEVEEHRRKKSEDPDYLGTYKGVDLYSR